MHHVSDFKKAKYSTDRKIRIFASLLFNWYLILKAKADPDKNPVG
jgi:hypothetical protein